MKDLSKVLLSFIVGVLAGTATGLLLAPDNGKNTRKKIKNSINDLSEKAKDTINDISEKAKNTLNKEKLVKDKEQA